MRLAEDAGTVKRYDLLCTVWVTRRQTGLMTVEDRCSFMLAIWVLTASAAVSSELTAEQAIVLEAVRDFGA